MSPEQREQRLEVQRRYRETNRELIRARNRSHIRKPEYQAKRKAWYEKNRSRIIVDRRDQKMSRSANETIQFDLRDREYKLRSQYGITEKDYQALLARQGGVCALCGEENQQPKNKPWRRLAVDHCHKTGCVRGLLCTKCNTSLGNLGDTIEGLERALAYVRGSN